MTTRQWLVAVGLLGLVLIAIAGLVITGDSDSQSPRKGRRTPAVSERLLQTARNLTASASTRDERRYAQQALKLADHEVDLAFADALQQAPAQPNQQSPEVKEIQARISMLEKLLKTHQRTVRQLNRQMASADAAGREVLQQQLDLAEAQLELDKDELEDVQGRLRLSGADPLTRIRRQFERHKATHDDVVAPPAAANPTANAPAASLLANIRSWYALKERTSQIESAMEEAKALSTRLDQEHDALAAQLQDAARPLAMPSQLSSQGSAERPAAGAAAKNARQAVESLRELAREQKHLVSLNERGQDALELAEIYTNWITSLQLRQKRSFQGVIRSALWILLIALGMYLALRVVDRVDVAGAVERARIRTLRTILRVATQVLGVLLIVLIVFGTPNQMSTILGLAGAGFTVVMKDFIVAFCGWFVLMGRNGIRAGDWVEINGVVGEVTEVNLLRTVLLETGNWTDTGHPTGRKVAFMNGYAIEGHFFNFSTSGQWLWDDLQITVPANENPYPVIEAIQRLVVEETGVNANLAEQEWKSAAGRYRSVQSVSAVPAVFVRPTSSGVEVHVRYVSKASERYAIRARLYRAVVELLHGREVPEPEQEIVSAGD